MIDLGQHTFVPVLIHIYGDLYHKHFYGEIPMSRNLDSPNLPIPRAKIHFASLLLCIEGGVRGVRKPQNRTEIRQKTANRIEFFPEYRNRTSSSLSVATSTTSVAIVAH